MNRLLLLALLVPLLGTQQGGFISGVVHDRSGGFVAAAEVRVQSQETGARQSLHSDAAGAYGTNELAPGVYKVTVRSDGFRTVSQADISVTSGKTARVDFVIEVLPLQQEVTVTAAQSDVDPTASGLTMSRETPSAALPQNGRDVHALFTIMPGATVTPASISSGGQFTVSGQRPNTNSFWVDGVSGNLGVGAESIPGALPGGNLPAMTTIGGMQSLASGEETEKVELRSDDFSAELADRPGAQIIIETRGGSNEFHGSAFGYLRPRFLDSLDWFARGTGLNLPSAYLNGFGGALGGPLRRNHTFVFASFEKTGLQDSAVQSIAVPSLMLRQQAGPYQALFDAFPLPQGRALNAYEALSDSPLQKDATVTNHSVRLDQIFGSHARGFARYSDVPSTSSNTELGTAYSTFHWVSATGGLSLVTGKFTHELRFNFSRAASYATHGPQDAAPIASLIAAVGPEWGYEEVTRLSIEGVGQTIAGAAGQTQEHQFTGSYNVASHAGKHELRAGYANTQIQTDGPTFGASAALSIVSPSIQALLSGIPLGLTNSFGAVPGATEKYSIFIQDSVRVTDRLQILFGLRWDATPPEPGYSYPLQAFPASFSFSYWNGIGSQPVYLPNAYTQSTYSNWPARYTQIAPRLGLAYRLKPLDLVMRAGGGLFYDTGFGSIVSNTNPLNIWQYSPNTANPVDPTTSPILLPRPNLYLPRIWEWKTSLEKSLREESLLSLSYSGSLGGKLLRNEATLDPTSQFLQSLQFTSSGKSNYNALLANFRANLTPQLYTLVSYTWGHSIDTGSSDTAPVLAGGPSNKGSSSFDVRQVLTASLGYRTPQSFGHLLGGWTLSSNSFVRTGFPFNVTTVDESIGLGFDNADRANLVPGQPIWINNGGLPGGRELNPAAFPLPANGTQGSLGRNVLVGAGLFQIDASVRRQIRLYRGSSVEASVSAFNVLNHASFSNPVGYLGSALFGESTSMTNLMLGSGSPTTGLTPLFQAGGPRTVELSLRFSF